MAEQNWGLLKFKYEVLGASLEAISADHGVSLPVLTLIAEEWKPLPLESMKEVPLEELKTFDEVVEKLKSNTISQMQAFNILKDKFLSSKYVELESLLLIKTIEVMNSIEDSGLQAANIIQKVAAVFTSLKAIQNPVDTSTGSGTTKWEVTVLDGSGEKRESDGS